MKSVAIIGFAGKGLFDTPLKIDNLKDLHLTFGKRANLVSVAEQIIYEDHKPIIVRLNDESTTASAYLLDEDDTICMMVEAESPGVIGNLTTVEITRSNDSFNLIIFNSGEMVEFWGDLQLDQVEEIINFASKWINISLVKQTCPAAGNIKLSSERSKEPKMDVRQVSQALKSIECLDIEFIVMPDFDCNSTEVINYVLEYLEEEKPETILIIDSPWEFDLLQTYKWCKGLIPSNNGVVCWPWLKYEQESIPSSGSVVSAITNWPFPWKPIRTKLTGDTMFEVYPDELIYLSKQEHIINILNKKNGYLFIDGTISTLGGQKLSERRLINYIKYKISKLGIELLNMYNPVNSDFRNNFIESSEYILEQIKEDRGINNYNIWINELGNPAMFEVEIDLAIKDSVEIINIYFKFGE